ncbi:MAG TPA: response regulator [Methylomirabilota bacterium]|nr:response regulator [Methylomirabilota bacterium]
MDDATRDPASHRRLDPDLSGVHVLIVEDTPDSREGLRILFEYCGAEVRTAESAEEGKRLLDQERPDVMVSDIAMPDNGIELIRAVKASADARDLQIPVIAVTAYRDRRPELLAEGFDELVEKPLDLFKLCGVVRRHVH